MKPTDSVFRLVPRLRTFKGGWRSRERARKWFNGDLQRAGIPVENDQGESVDLHALKTTFANWLMEYGVSSGKADRLTRHGSGGGTRVRHYVKASYHDPRAEIPKLPGPRPTSERTQVRATGTDAADCLPEKVALPVALSTTAQSGLKLNVVSDR